MLKPKTLVNVYGLVTFFKHISLMLNYCSTLKITDKSDVKVGLIFRVGDIIRLHRFKVRRFDLFIPSSGIFKVGPNHIFALSSDVQFCFWRKSNKRTVQELCQWAANQSWISSDLTVSLSSVQPGKYFDLTCKLLARTIKDSRCILLKVWDGTKCQHPLLNVAVASDTLEEESTVAKDRMNLTAKVLVYKNHLEAARDLKVSMFLRFYNLHALLQRAPDQVLPVETESSPQSSIPFCCSKRFIIIINVENSCAA
uniref:Protection of telomeres protein 1 ssDNA-binding domain-containing protein n=1 Tax=Cyprinus carpio TaxID=7962 RepID=A0A8C1YYV9_CYPCA